MQQNDKIKFSKVLLFLLAFLIVLEVLYNNNIGRSSASDIEVGNCGSWYYKTMALVDVRTIPKNLGTGKYTYFTEKAKVSLLLHQKYPDKFVKETKTDTAFAGQDSIYKIFNRKIASGKFFDPLTEIVAQLLEKKQMSKDLAFKLEQIHLLTQEDADSKTIVKALNDLKYAKLTQKDDKYRVAFVSVYLASYSFCRSKAAEPLKIPRANCCRAISLTTATGALFGIDKTPERAVTEALVFSSLATVNTPCNAVAPARYFVKQ